MFYEWTEEEFVEALRRVFVRYFGGGELIYSSDGMWTAYFGSADEFAATVFELDFLEPGLPEDIACVGVVNSLRLDAYKVACEVIEANAYACALDPWGVLHDLLAFDSAGKPRAYYDVADDPDGLLLYFDWVDLCGRSHDDEPEWLAAYRAGVPVEDLANGLPPDGLLR